MILSIHAKQGSTPSKGVRERTRMLNKLHGFFVEQGVTTITKKDLAKEEARSATLLQLSRVYRTMAIQDCTLLDAIEAQIVLVNEQIHQMLCAMQGEAEILMSIPGVGPVAALLDHEEGQSCLTEGCSACSLVSDTCADGLAFPVSVRSNRRTQRKEDCNYASCP